MKRRGSPFSVMWEKINDQQALTKKPGKLPEIESELQVNTPRPMVWVYPKTMHREIPSGVKNLLTGGCATRAWITQYKTLSDRECTDHFVQYCFEAGSRIIHGKNYWSFDDLHLAYGAPDYAIWIVLAYKYNKSFTVLYNSEDPILHEIYGHLELYIDEDLLRLSQKIEKCRDAKELHDLSGKFLKIALGPLRSNGVIWDKYLDLMKEFGLAGSSDIYDSDKNIQIIKNIVPRRDYSQEILKELSDLCREFIPGFWAAK